MFVALQPKLWLISRSKRECADRPLQQEDVAVDPTEVWRRQIPDQAEANIGKRKRPVTPSSCSTLIESRGKQQEYDVDDYTLLSLLHCGDSFY